MNDVAKVIQLNDIDFEARQRGASWSWSQGSVGTPVASLPKHLA